MHGSALDTLVTFNPWTLSSAATLLHAAQQLEEIGITAWPVVEDDGAYVGVLAFDRLELGLLENPSSLAAAWADRSVQPIQLGASPKLALELMLQYKLHMLPVADAGRIVGTLAASDFLRELSYGSGKAAHELIVDHLQRNSETIDGDATLDQATAAINAGPQHLVVVQGDLPLGVVTRESLTIARVQRFARQQRGPHTERTLGQLLHSIPTVTPGRTLSEAAAVMVEHQHAALAVAGQSAQLLGVLTEQRILQAVLAL